MHSKKRKKPIPSWLKRRKFRVPWKNRISQDAEYKKKRRIRQAERKGFKVLCMMRQIEVKKDE